MDQGSLVPDEIVDGVVDEQLRTDARITGGFVLDGYPRNRHQAQRLDETLGDAASTSPSTSTSRPRWCCTASPAARVPHAVQRRLPPRQPARARLDLRRLQRLRRAARRRHTADTVMRRLELYEMETLPVIQYYRRAGILAHVDGGAG